MLQELLTNVARHAHATHVQLQVDIQEDGIDLSVRDDGVGFDHQPHSPGMGLLGMRERALSQGGHLVIDSQPGMGTVIRCHLPIATSRPIGSA
jgi:signal transduction histidine kinase